MHLLFITLREKTCCHFKYTVKSVYQVPNWLWWIGFIEYTFKKSHISFPILQIFMFWGRVLFSLLKFKFLFTKVQLIYNAVPVYCAAKVTQFHTYTNSLIFFSITIYSRRWIAAFLCFMQWGLSQFIHSKYNSLPLPTPNSQSISPFSPPHANHKSDLYEICFYLAQIG